MDPADVAFASAVKQVQMLAAGTITAPQLLDIYLDRIARLDPLLRSFRVVLTDSARQEAVQAQRHIDDYRRDPGNHQRLRLAGVPVAIKDDIDVKGQLTTFGSSAVTGPKPQDAEVVKRLRAAGAVIIGKTNVPELMTLPFCESETFGATRNPWDPTLTPGGSSGGNGAAVAAGLVSLAVGSDGGGSIRIPSSWCGVFGLKTQRGQVPLEPRKEPWCGLDVYGPMARSVEDAALFLDVAGTGGPPDRFVAAAAAPPKKLNIALSTEAPPLTFAKVGKLQLAAVESVGKLLSGQGHDVRVGNPDYPWQTILGYYLPRYFRGIYNDVTPLDHPERLEARTRHMARVGSRLSDRCIEKVRAQESELATRIGPLFEKFDVLITPGNAKGPSRIGAYSGRGVLSSLLFASSRVPFYETWNMTGQPAAVLPWGQDNDGIPVSVQLICKNGDVETLLAVSAQLERLRPGLNLRPRVS